MGGRKRKPTELKKLLGNPGKRRLNENEPQPEGVAAKPKFLKGRASKLWDEYAPKLSKMRVLTAVDSHTLAAWCCLAAELEADPNRMVAARIAQMRSLASSLGMDPSARARMSVGDGDKKDGDGAEKYFAQDTDGPGTEVLQ